MKFRALCVGLLLLAGATGAEARPRHWYKDWKWWVGEAVIAGAFVADAHSTSLAQSQHIGIESSPFLGSHPDNKSIVGLSLTGFAIETGIHAGCWHFSHEDTKPWRVLGYTAIPLEGVLILGRAAKHNYELVDKSK
jgi:hypothetical protein